MNISFPRLGIDFTLDRVAFSVFGFDVYWYGIIIAFGFAMGIFMASIAAKKLGEDKDIVLDIALICGPVSVVFARLYYCIFKWEDYAHNPLSVFDIRSGGIAIYGAIIGAVIAALIFCRVKKKNTLKIFDIGAVGLITGQMIGRWGNFVNQEAFGSNTTLPWGMTGTRIREYLAELKAQGYVVFPDQTVHPTFLYESIWSLATLVLLFVIIYKCYRYNGQVFFAYTSLYGLGRFWIEGLRTDSLMLGSIRISQAVAFVCFVLFAILYFACFKKQNCDK